MNLAEGNQLNDFAALSYNYK